MEGRRMEDGTPDALDIHGTNPVELTPQVYRVLIEEWTRLLSHISL